MAECSLAGFAQIAALRGLRSGYYELGCQAFIFRSGFTMTGDAVPSSADAPDRARKSRPKWPWIAAVAAVLFVFVFYQVFFLVDEIDINSGRLRAGFCIGPSRVLTARTYDTEYSKLIASRIPTQAPDWRRVNTFRLFDRYSPHHRHHTMPDKLSTLCFACREAGLTDEETVEIALQAFPRLRSGSPRDHDAIGQLTRPLLERMQRSNPNRSSSTP